MDGLPTIDSCDGCGLCCLSQSFPPGFSAWFAGRRDVVYDEDVQILAAMPRVLHDELSAIHESRHTARAAGDRAICPWFDAGSLRCRHYEHRPILCREFERGGAACRQWREQLSVSE